MLRKIALLSAFIALLGGCAAGYVEEFVTAFPAKLSLKDGVVLTCNEGLTRFSDRTGSYYRCRRGRAGKYVEYRADNVLKYEPIF